MPHSEPCQREAPEGFCIGDGCTAAPDDYPGLYKVLSEAIPPAPDGYGMMTSEQSRTAILETADRMRRGEM